MLNKLIPIFVNVPRIDRAILPGGDRVRLAEWRCQQCNRLLRAVDFEVSEHCIALVCPDDGVEALNIELQ
jgi:hypothetical protein